MGALICKPSEEELDDSSLWDFCGRVKDIEKILKKIQAKRTKTMCVYGAKSIGKSRVIRQVLLSEQLQKYEHSCYVDLSLFSQNSTDKPAFVNRLEKFCEIVQLDMKLPLTTCEKCELCTKNIGCSSLLEKVTNEFVQMQQECLVCFDNADKLMNSIFQPYFLKFLKTVTDHGKHTKLLITSTVRIHMSSKASKLYLLNEMENADLRELLDQILLESIEDDEIPKSSLNISDHWIDAVVTLCDGIPKVAEILGMFHYHVFINWTASSEFGTYRLCEQRRFRRACASAQSRQNLRCSLIQAVSQEEPSDRKQDPWPLWMAGHAQLKFVVTECSKTQIRLTGLNWNCKCFHFNYHKKKTTKKRLYLSLGVNLPINLCLRILSGYFH